MVDEATGWVTEGYCVVEQHGLIHAVKVTAGVLTGTGPDTVTTVCNHQMPRQGVRREWSWDEQLKMPRAPTCDECKALAPEHRVYGGKDDPKYHLVTDSMMALGGWWAICTRLVVPGRGPHLWGEGDAYCSVCEDLAGPAMRAQMAREEAERKRIGEWWNE
jgi:hypothetical protein